jgi:hypothetical protein
MSAATCHDTSYGGAGAVVAIPVRPGPCWN